MVPKLGAAALRQLMRRGVGVELNTSAAAIDAEGADLADGRRIQAGTIVATIGSRPNRLLATLGAPLDRGRLCVGPDLAVTGLPHVWALGDCAHALNAADGATCPPTAQFAVAQAKQLAETLIAVTSGKPSSPFMFTPRGAMAATGHRNGVAEIFGLRFAGLAAWLAWRGYYLLLLPTWGRKVRVGIEWAWGMFFAPDITHIHFVRSGGGSGAPMVAQRRSMTVVPEMPSIAQPD